MPVTWIAQVLEAVRHFSSLWGELFELKEEEMQRYTPYTNMPRARACVCVLFPWGKGEFGSTVSLSPGTMSLSPQSCPSIYIYMFISS